LTSRRTAQLVGIALACTLCAGRAGALPTPVSFAPAPGAPAASAPAAPAQPRAEPQPAAEDELEAEPEFGATAHVARPEPGARRLELREMRDLPGAFGDPYRAIDSLPGVVPVLSGLPYVYVRGAPPASTLYVYDDIPVPTLYHLGILNAVIHPRMVGPVRLYSGVAPARYGRLTGGAIVGEGPERPDGTFHGEMELRLIDVSAYAQAPGLGGNVTAAVRYGYPGLLLSIFSPDVSVAYWDYQLRYETPIAERDRLELVALGSYDSVGDANDASNDLVLTFHRVEPRLIRELDDTEYGAALLCGWEQSELGQNFDLQAVRLGPRLWVAHRFDATTNLRLSADLVGVAGSFSGGPVDPDGGRAAENLFGDVPARSMWGVQGELGLQPAEPIELKLGARADAWVQGAGAEGVLDPRARVILHASDTVDVHVAGGVAHQPAVFYIPLPGVVDVAIDRGLQTALQSEFGVGWDTPLAFRAEGQVFVHRYLNLVFIDALALEESFEMICRTIDCGDATLGDRIDGTSYGGEVFLRRSIDERISGWLSYTLAWSTVDDVAGMAYTPTWDVRHLGNLVLQWDIGGGFSTGGRLHARSGKLHGEFLVDDQLRLARDERRLPWFARLDLLVAYAWHPGWGRMRVSLEWFNATLSREPIDILCTGSPRTCKTQYLPAIFFPNLGVRGEI
jgi:hypothetical protein